jgi:pimeloyl-[acyl-carrier protein] methyl ester esterase
LSLHVETLGRGTDLVLLHGWGMNAGVWAPVLDNLADRFHVHLVELPGHGASPCDPACSTLADWAGAVREAVPRGAAWIGWSLGGQVALRAALDAPDEVASLVLVAATPRFVQDADWPHAMEKATFRQFADNLAADHGATLERFLALQVRGAEHAKDTLRWLREEVRGRPAPLDAALDNGLRLLLDTDLRDDLRRLSCPVLWLLGERDTLVPADVSHELEGLHPDAEILVIGGAAHAPFLSHPARSLQLLEHFLDEVPAHA